MSFRLLLPFVCILGTCALGGCASLPGPDLPTCDGAARRPANPHGSILSPGPALVAVAANDAGAHPSGGDA
nr:hypothetical protein [Brevundimonas diminuta]